MNPFDLRGPEFLFFYFIFSVVVLLILLFLRERDDRGDAGKPPLDDPYLIAFLRGGESEALRVAALSLIDRGLLTLKKSGTTVIFQGGADTCLEAADPRAVESVKRPIEKRILEVFKKPQPVTSTLDSLAGCTPCVDYEVSLEKFGLLPGQELQDARQRRFFIAAGALVGVAVLKILIALLKGHTNIIFLIILAGLATYVTSRTSNPFRTGRGEKFLEDVKSLFRSLHDRAASLRPGGATADLVWLASAYGLGEVPPILFPQVTALMPRKRVRSSGFGSWDSSGSSCGTFSSCGSGSSSCGGGGCGGGGCGGCGS